jgi:cytochrome c1
MTKSFTKAVLAAAMLALPALASPASAAGEGPEIARHKWRFGGPTGKFDRAQLQRGFQVYEAVCSACHGLKRVYFRNLSESGGPQFPEDRVKELAAKWPNQIHDGPNEQGQVADRRGQLLKRPARLADPILGPYDNEQAARAAQNGAYPPDLSLITKARSAGGGSNVIQTFGGMPRDILSAYQESGADYVYALMTGYTNPPADKKNPDGTPFKLAEGMHYNKAFTGYQIAMAPQLRDNMPNVKYQDGTPMTVAQYAEDVTAFLHWAADPRLEDRKTMGHIVMLYLLITTLLLYFAKKRLWSRVH